METLVARDDGRVAPWTPSPRDQGCLGGRRRRKADPETGELSKSRHSVEVDVLMRSWDILHPSEAS